MDSLIVKALGGLCNKLRVTFTYHEKAKSENNKLIIIWTVDQYCPGFFLDYFEPIENITFVRDSIGLKIDISTWEKNEAFDNLSIYSKLKVLPHLENKIKNNIELLENNYVAVHIRRTDNEESIKKSPDSTFIKFIDENKFANLYIATDNPNTQNIFIKKYKDKIKTINLIKSRINTIRYTNLELAIIDLYTCINASKFLGSYYSSFTDFIVEQREFNKLEQK
jgi:hypothetical protein